MATAHITVTATTTPSLLYRMGTSGTAKKKVYLANRSATNTVYVGDSTITNADGYPLLAQAATGVQHRAEFEMFPGDELWVVSGATTSVVTILVMGV